MYTTNKFEQAILQKGYELEHIYYNPQQTVLQAVGYVVKNNQRIKMRWNYLGRAFRSAGPYPEFDLFSICCLDEAIDHVNDANGSW